MTDRIAETNNTLESLANQLAGLARDVDVNDLRTLAKMHGVCDALSLANAAGGTGPTQPTIALAQAIGSAIEALILGEASDAAAALQEIVAKSTELVTLVTDAASTAPVAEETPATTDVSDDVAAQLALADSVMVSGEPECAAAPTESEAPVSDAAPEPAVECQAEPEPAVECQAEPEPTVECQAAPAAVSAPAPEARPSYQQEPLTLKSDELDFVRGFTDEAMEHIANIEASLLEVEAHPEDKHFIDDLFRPFHTIKGISGFLNLRDINSLTHETETLLDQGRKGKRQLTTDLIDVIFDVVDILKVQIAAVAGWVASPNDEVISQPPVAEMIDQLRALVAGEVVESKAQTRVAPAAPRVETAAESTSAETPAGTPTATPAATEGRSAGATERGEQSGGGENTIRIDTAKLDALVDMVGELVISQALVNANPQASVDEKLAKNVAQVSKIVREVQQVAMAMRMVPIGPTFQKMARLVRDVSRKAGKQVRLTISGEDTELDKTVIQQIGDPLVHMVRNAVDHGIEAADERRAAGKPEVGEVHLAARHQGGNIIIEISDDGKGLDPQVLIKKAIDKGIIQSSDELTPQQAYGLIFAAGFSTAKQITDISGRGVGMDVVKRSIDRLRGTVEISSEVGRGSVFSIHLPLTLAIIDGMIVRVAGERFIVPTIAIEQSLRPTANQVVTVQERGEILNVRGQLVPLIQLGELFHLTGRINPADAMVMITSSAGQSVGLVVEELIGQQQVVIKTLGERFKSLQGVSGAAILGDGKVGLILEPPGLIALHHAWSATTSYRRRATAVARDHDDDSVSQSLTPVHV